MWVCWYIGLFGGVELLSFASELLLLFVVWFAVAGDLGNLVVSGCFVLGMCIVRWWLLVLRIVCAALLVTVFVTVVACFVFGYVRCV